jgi:hypothetical protein
MQFGGKDEAGKVESEEGRKLGLGEAPGNKK